VHKAAFYAVIGLIITSLSLHTSYVWAHPIHSPRWTAVESKFLAKSGRQSTYPKEYLPLIEVRNQHELGKLTALRFIEWVQHNPKGVVAFTSGKTPEFFVKFLDYYKNNWHRPQVQTELHSMGIKLKNFPDTSNLKLVQIEEIYPMSESHYKKISNYLRRHYVKILGIKPENLLLMDMNSKGILAEKGMNVVFMNGKVDLSIMQRPANSQLERWQQQALKEVNEFCDAYESKIRSWGGIDFFIGGLSYNGSIGYTESGVSVNSKTHIHRLDYEAAAISSKDLGGIEYARGKIAITIGLGTIAINPKAVMILMVLGEAKSTSVQNVVENKMDPKYPASTLQKFPNSRMYATYGATKLLDNRHTEDMRFKSRHGWMQQQVAEVIIEIALDKNKEILSLTDNDLRGYDRGRMLLEHSPKPLPSILLEVRNEVIKKIENGLSLPTSKASTIIHTGPHHDDIFSGYYPLFDFLSYKYKNNFLYFTSGYNSVSDNYILSVLNRASDGWIDKEHNLLLHKPYEKTLPKFHGYFLRQDVERMKMLETTIALKHLVSIYKIKTLDELKHTIRWLKDEYFPNKQPGDLDISEIKLFKGMIRESEADLLWSLRHMPLNNIHHLRAEFYSGREFMKTPRYETDVVNFITLYNKFKPDIITVADDSESALTPTNYKVLQIIAQGLRSKQAAVNDNLQIWGYRNIWSRYKVAEANIYVPVSERMMVSQKRVYDACFNTQKQSSFPSPFHNGDSVSLTTKIQRDQYQELKVLLGSEYFSNNQVSELRNAVGFVFLNKMSLNEMLRRAEDLQQAIDLEDSYIASKK
jgi:glucosamine-6-phosphate deaminase